ELGGRGHRCTAVKADVRDFASVQAAVARAKETEGRIDILVNNIGVTGGAFDSYLLLRGLRTLVPRMELAQRNAQAIVDYLQT
ncbi:SDR family oxidoreductase, partial [Salmonella enterica subsp. enterica serovar Montevideo]|nr:SDR family oxidoreductase [Salmonella enterica subsp. enterica serovar Montevideo]